MGFARTCLTTPTVRPELVEGLSNSVLLIDLIDPVPPWSAIAICQPAVGGGGLRTEAAVLNNPAAGFTPTVGKAPSFGLPSTGREPHAIPGVKLPLAVILTAHRLQPPLHPARQTASGLDVIGTSKSKFHLTSAFGVIDTSNS